MSLTISQLAAILGIDSLSISQVSDRLVLVHRDPQPDETGLPVSTGISFRLIDLSCDPTDPAYDYTALEFAATRSMPGGGTDPLCSYVGGVFSLDVDWTGSLTTSTAADPYVFWQVDLVQTVPPLFGSEEDVEVEIVGDIDAAPAGTLYGFPFGTVPGAEAFSFSYTFTTEDIQPPKLIAAQGIDLTTVRVTFDDSMDSDTVTDLANWDLIDCLNVDPKPGAAVAIVSIIATDITSPILIPVFWTYADAAARVGATGFENDDVGRLAYQQDTASYWMLTATAPTWMAVDIGDQFDITLDVDATPACSYRMNAKAAVKDASGNGIDSAYLTTRFTGWEPPRPDGRMFSHWRQMVSMADRMADASHDAERFSNCIQEILDLLLYDVDRFTDQIDPDRATDEQIDLMLYDMGNPFVWSDLDLSAIQRRKLLRYLVEIYKLKGTGIGIERTLYFLPGVVATVEDYLHEGWRLGYDTLGTGSIAQISCWRNETYDFSGAPLTLTVKIDGGAAQTITFELADFAAAATATAEEVVIAIEGHLVGGGAFVRYDGSPAYTDTTGTPEPYPLTPGDTLDLTVNGTARTITFAASDFGAIGAATAAEVGTVIEREISDLESGVTAGNEISIWTKHRGADARIGVVGGTAPLGFAVGTYDGNDLPRVTIYSDTSGRDASVEVTGGTANAVLEFSDQVAAGTGGCVLGPSDQHSLYCFDIETAIAVSAETESLIRKIAEYMKPCHTHLVNIRTARPLPWPDGWVLGQSALGAMTVLVE
jgi:phage tail-like protein